jgi:pescadillo protein
VDPSDEAAVCGSLFRGRIFFLGREVPREPLMLVIRAFGGVAAWDGEGSPYAETDEAVTHQVVDRPKQGHKFLSREYVQPQWVFDSANFRVLMPSDLYAPGAVPPPHLSPFVGEADEDGYTPDFAKTVRRLQVRAWGLGAWEGGVQGEGWTHAGYGARPRMLWW